ncbi:isoprenylcysteine carboxyl methyltransferase family protein [Ureibacillus aquaedulcis]|uniref:Isoprenylcysteine carboxylmethyltransferase family protein n=1 Tax=Ureibacillus aquaedulcis TaxID=3058421 RepID=A0ABT8GUT3_9BACL|nr:isoprenylcysteine carboxylmethyltransferase family protein [Ureibacillus sp. BA0131]MDN4495177.1 isoprenylcysteine carboxylmethyltransferase family protein [Ureibacillus sp. BA0131]
MFFVLFVSIVILQRIIEVIIARRNEKRMLAAGAYEAGASHYPIMIALHVGFFISLIIEVVVFERTISPLFIWLFILFFLVQVLRVWCLASLGPFWNTKIIILPGANVVKKGPYRLFRHPNYLVVCIEILLLPLMFQAYFTAICFTLLNFAMLAVRIPTEERALMEATNYSEKFKKKETTILPNDQKH